MINKIKFIYISKCYENCPYWTYNHINNYKCEEYHPECKTWDKPSEINSTNCKSCFPDKFLNFGNCVANVKMDIMKRKLSFNKNM